MRKYSTALAQTLAAAFLFAAAAAGLADGREPVVRRTKDALHAHVQARIEIHRQKLPEEFQHRKNFAWAVAKADGLTKQEYFAHSGIQNLDDLSDEAVMQIRGISIAPSNAVFETLCVNRRSEVNGPDCWDRKVDTEFKILEDIAAQLGKQTNAAGRIRLYTDLYPCKSCLHVMEQFMEKYPNIALEVLYKD
ncbi:MAG TPA: deaminase domain-containing protein [Kiritimatiellia bacterium]|nr:deaminase domain-containing protein [Kiritimatiellia bacterium]HNS80787.1 deaminase domain-containing protein [Kiritimatiellia bacterium]HPA77122.1 deaminase domain-containing protein [Kiritimatiellia bacterium]HQQ03293.1 deaminase domain-containing protein [Kiritimatiellia bacterium]